MKHYSLFILFSFFVWSCSEKKPNSKILKQDTTEVKIEVVKMDTSIALDQIKSKNVISITNEPCTEIKEFVADIENLNWVADTNRLKKIGIYSELDRENVTYFNDRPFYPIKFEKSSIYNAYTSEPYMGYLETSDLEFFKGVKNIWGYFYKDIEATNLISDGVIEQWEFATEVAAEKAFKKIIRRGDIIYFNTNPYFSRIRNKLIIFQSRAMAFSHDQKPVFEKFVAEKLPTQ